MLPNTIIRLNRRVIRSYYCFSHVETLLSRLISDHVLASFLLSKFVRIVKQILLNKTINSYKKNKSARVS